MGRNPAFGLWQDDDVFPDQCWKVENNQLNSRGQGSRIWDLRGNEKKTNPCKVKIGKYVIEDVIFPKKKATIERVKCLAEKATIKYGRKNNPEEYPLSGRISPKMIPFYRYCLAKLLTQETCK